MQQYDPTKYLPDPSHPELVCPVEDYECSSVKDFELHLLTYHDAEEHTIFDTTAGLQLGNGEGNQETNGKAKLRDYQ